MQPWRERYLYDLQVPSVDQQGIGYCPQYSSTVRVDLLRCRSLQLKLDLALLRRADENIGYSTHACLCACCRLIHKLSMELHPIQIRGISSSLPGLKSARQCSCILLSEHSPESLSTTQRSTSL